MGQVQKLCNWVPHELTKRVIENRLTMSELLLQTQKRLGSFTSPAKFTRHRSFRLPFVLIDAVSPYRREVQFVCRYQKLA